MAPATHGLSRAHKTRRALGWATAEPTGSLADSFVVGYASLVGTPQGDFAALTTPTQSQGGVVDVGGGADVLVMFYPHSLSAGTLL